MVEVWVFTPIARSVAIGVNIQHVLRNALKMPDNSRYPGDNR